MLNFNPSSQVVPPKSHKIDLGSVRNKGVAFDKSEVGSRPPLRRSKAVFIRATYVGAIVLALIIATRTIYHRVVYAGIDTKRYQAVYLTNDNVYFGKVHIMVNGSIFLTDSFRVEAASSTSTTSQGASSSSSSASSSNDKTSDIRLIKPGKELHAPDDTMLINRGNVLFIENLKADGKVTQAILEYHKENPSN